MTRILRKILISLVIGAFAYFINEVTGQPAALSVTISVLIGGVVMVAQFLIEFESRLTAVEAASRQHMVEVAAAVQTGFQKINEVTQLFHRVEESAIRTEVVTRLVHSSTEFDPKAPPLAFRFVHAELDRMSEFLRDLGTRGPLIYEGEDRDWLLSLARTAQLSIDAVSLGQTDGDGRALGGGFWLSDLGRRYLDLQREAIARKVRIRRIFVPRRTDPTADDGVLALCRAQQEAGVEVRLLDWANLRDSHRESPFDFIIFDAAISYEVTPAPTLEDEATPVILNTRLELRPERIRDRLHRFEQLWALGREMGHHRPGPCPVSR